MGAMGRVGRAHIALAKRGDAVDGGLVGDAVTGDDGGHGENALAEFNAVSAVGHVEPERDAFRIELPEAEGARVGLHSVCVTELAVEGGEIPGQHALGNDVAPAEIAVAALPGVAEHFQLWRRLGLPA